MAVIINYQMYVNAKTEEKQRIKKILMLSSKRDNILRLIDNINNCIGVSFVTKHLGELNQIVGKEDVIESDLLDVIISSIKKYEEDIQNEISKLKSVNCVG